MAGEAALIWAPFPDEESARRVADRLLSDRLIACANLLPGVQSLFTWTGEREENTECGALCKTTATRRAAAVEQLAALHPYETPAVTSWTVHAEPATLAWLEAETAVK